MGDVARRGWLSLPAWARALVAVASVALAAGALAVAGIGTGGLSGQVRTLSSMASDPAGFAARPDAIEEYLSLILSLSVVLAVSLVDISFGLWACIAATMRHAGDYPEGTDKATWVAGMWSANLAIQLPTGVPSAAAYWIAAGRFPKTGSTQAEGVAILPPETDGGVDS